ncbi:MAG: YlbF family regulator [Clostridia bacterium]|nr:YlbF family regulator [Clostridia bacterium]
MDVMQLAKALGEGIKNHPTLLAYDEAKAAFDADTELAAQMNEYNADRSCLAEEFNKDFAMQDKDVIESLKAKMDELAAVINKNEHYVAFAAAQGEVNTLMQSINEEITFYAFGVRPNHCTHDCSSCSGCH